MDTAVINYADKLSISGLLPPDFRKNPANILYAIELSRALNVTLAAAMNGIYTVNGRMGFRAEFMLAQANASGIFKRRIDFDTNYKECASSGRFDGLWVEAFAQFHDGVEARELVTMQQAIAAGWTRNAQYKTDPLNMLKKRAVTRLISNWCPEVMGGYKLDDPADDFGTINVTATDAGDNAPSPLAKVRAMLERVKADPSQENADAIALEAAVEETGAESAPQRMLDLSTPRDRALVAGVVKALKPDGQVWLSRHRDGFKQFLMSHHVAATPEAVEAALAEFEAQVTELEAVGAGHE